MKITIIYDNEVYKKDFRLEAAWGFSCLIETDDNYLILFDTGGDGQILMNNMIKLGIDKNKIDKIFISHLHWDHIGGLLKVFRKEQSIYVPKLSKKLKLKVPPSYLNLTQLANVKIIKDVSKVHDNIYSTGELREIEQSLILKTDKGLVIVVGCSHPGLRKIFTIASQFGNIYALIGGLHGFDDYDLLKNIDLICPTHCTEHQREIISRYPDKCIRGGVGRIIEI